MSEQPAQLRRYVLTPQVGAELGAAHLALLILAAALVQVTAGLAPALAGAEPNLVLALVVAQAWLRGPERALWPALAGGLLLDLASPGPLGVHPLALLGAALVAGWLAESQLQRRLLLAALAAPPALIVYSAVVLGAARLLRQPLPPLQVAASLVLAGCLLQALLALPATLLLGLAPRLQRTPAPPAGWRDRAGR